MVITLTIASSKDFKLYVACTIARDFTITPCVYIGARFIIVGNI